LLGEKIWKLSEEDEDSEPNSSRRSEDRCFSAVN
jgi:hypothetical protein